MERRGPCCFFYMLLCAALMAAVESQIPLPRRPLGFVYKGGEPSAPIHLTAFVDLLCPDSKQAWPTVKKVADMYGSEVVQFTLQLFPLPYHTNAFMAAQVSVEYSPWEFDTFIPPFFTFLQKIYHEFCRLVITNGSLLGCAYSLDFWWGSCPRGCITGGDSAQLFAPGSASSGPLNFPSPPTRSTHSHILWKVTIYTGQYVDATVDGICWKLWQSLLVLVN